MPRTKGVVVSRAARWVITLVAGGGVFALGWWVCDSVLAMGTGDALGIAAVPSSLVTTLLGWWSGREQTDPITPVSLASSQHNSIGRDAAGVVQARDVGGSINSYYVDHMHVAAMPPVLEPAAGQIVVGPVPREPQHFQSRPQVDDLARLGESGAVAVVCAVTGLRGVGKTQMAGAYARRRIADGWLVAWIPAETPDAVVAGLGELAETLKLRVESENAKATLARVRSYLQTVREPVLVVFDNVTNPDDVTPYLPASGRAQVVLTSATHTVEQVGTPVPVDLFTPDTAVRFLIDTTGVRDRVGAQRLAAELGYLPLALAQAAARIVRAERDYTGYLDSLSRVALGQVLKSRSGDPYPRGAAEAILLAVEPFMTEDLSAEQGLLDLLSVLSPDGVSRDLLATGYRPAQFGDLLERLFEASLIEFAGSADSVVVVMHRLTQRALQDRVNHDLPGVLDRATALLDQAIFPEADAWLQREHGDELIRHIDTLWQHANRTAISAIAPTCLLALRRWGVRQLIASTALDRSIRLAADVHVDHRRIHGDNHPDTLSSVNNLAYAYRSVGRLDEAIPLFEQNLADRRRVLGHSHPDTLNSVNNLANAYESVGRLDKAIPLYEQNLTDAHRVLGDSHPDTLNSVNNLANAYESVGRLDEAIPLFEQNLADRRRVLDGSHRDILGSVNNLAGAYESAGRLDEAISLYEQNLADRRRVLGHSHPDTLGSVNNLVSAYWSVGRLDEAIPLFEQNLADRRRVLGDSHPDTLGSVSNLAGAYESAGRSDQAIRLYEQNLADRRRVLGDKHSSVQVVRDAIRRLRDQRS